MIKLLEVITFDFWNTLYKLPPRLVIDRTIENMHKVLYTYDYQLEIDKLENAFREAWQLADRTQREAGLEIGPKGQVHKILEILAIDLDGLVFAEFYRAFTDTLLDYPPVLNDDVAESLPILEKDFKLAVICNTGITPGVGLRKLMVKDKIIDYFSILTFSDELGIAKPNIDIFHHTLRLLGSDSGVAAHIGDDATTDVKGSKKAGMTSIWLAPLAEEAVPEADFHVKNVGELLNLF